MLLTRLWAVILALLATGCLAGMFLLSLGSGGDFSDADKAAIRAVTEAGIAALEAEIRSSRVQQAAGLVDNEQLQAALDRTPEQEENLRDNQLPRAQIVAELAEELRVRTESNMTIAAIDSAGQVVEANGLAEPMLGELVASAPYQGLPSDDDTMFSVILGGELNVAYVSQPDDQGRRIVAVDGLNTGGGSLLRRVLGSSNPAGLVRGGELVGDVIGDQPVKAELQTLAREHHADAPDTGASKVFVVGDGLEARIGSLGRIPGPAGKGKNGVLLGVVSRETAAAGQKDMAEALAASKQDAGQINWPLLAGLLVVSAGLAIYLPQIEALGPVRRLKSEFDAVAQGTQHQIFHDRYGGAVGELARSAANAHDALRRAYLAELEIEDDLDEESATAPRPRTRTTRGRKLTRGGRKPELTTKRRKRAEAEPAPEPAAAPEPEPAQAKSTPSYTPSEPPAAPALERPPPPGISAGRKPPPPPLKRPEPAEPKPMPPPGMTAPVPTADPKEAHYREVFDEFLQVKEACGEATNGFSYEKFSAKLRKNRDDLLKKRPGIKDVNFTVYVKDGKAALKAKVVKG